MLLVWAVAGVLSLPILIAVIFNVNQLMALLAERVLGSKAKRSFGQGHLAVLFEALSTCLFVSLAGGLFFSFASPYLPEGAALGGYCAVLVLAGVLLWNRLLRVNLQIEHLFLKELDEQLHEEDQVHRQEAFRQIQQLYPWPVQVEHVDLVCESEVVGKRIRDLDLRRLTGVSILGLGRGGEISYEPSPDITMFPGDRVYLFGTTSQINNARQILENSEQRKSKSLRKQADFRMETLFLTHDSPLVDATLAGSNLRQKYGINVLALQRGETRISPPDGEEMLREGDVLYVFGRSQIIQSLNNS